MQAQGTYAGGANRGNGFGHVRNLAYAEGLQRLAGRKSLATRLTPQQIEAMAKDAPFELADKAHPAFQAD